MPVIQDRYKLAGPIAATLCGAIIWFAFYLARPQKICQGQCAHGDKHCTKMCLDRGYCPRERE